MSDCTYLFDDDPAHDPLVRQLVVLTQAGLPLVEDPWAWLAWRLGIPVAQVLSLLSSLQQRGAIRRIAAVPDHYRLGYRYNGMTVWDVDDDQVDAMGQCVGGLPYVSHCYRRPRRDGWSYNLFVMVHGRSRDDVDHYRVCLRLLLGDACRADDMLLSTRILKKTGLRIGAVVQGATVRSAVPAAPQRASWPAEVLPS